MDLSLLRANVPSAKRTGLFDTESVSDALSQLVSALGPAEAEAGFAQALKPEVANVLRKTMAAEFRARGPALKAVADDAVSKVRGIVDKVTRGVWFHGRNTYPSYGKTFGGSRVKLGNVGEPYGLSLTAEPSVTQGFASTQGNISDFLGVSPVTELPEFKELQKLTNYKGSSLQGLFDLMNKKYGNSDPPIVNLGNKVDKLLTHRGLPINMAARVLPRFNAPPTDVILPAWKGEGTEWAQKILKEAYVDSLPGPVIDDLASLALNTRRNFNKSSKGIDRAINLDVKDSLYRKFNDADIDTFEFNQTIADTLSGKGFKGLLYSPQRYSEYELRMLDPSDVTMVDFRNTERSISKPVDPGLNSYLTGVLPKFSTFKARLDVLDDWNTQDVAGPSLRDIYSDIDWSSILK